MGRPKALEWENVEVIRRNDKGMHVIQCKRCNHVFSGGPHRIRAHLLGIKGQGVEICRNASNELQKTIRSVIPGSNANLDSQFREDVNVAQSNGESMPTGSTSTSVNDMLPPSRKDACKKEKVDASAPLCLTWDVQNRKSADEAVRRFFYAEDIPDWKVESPFFHDVCKALGKVEVSYKPPSTFQLRTKHFNEETQCVEVQLSKVKESWKTYGCTIVSDGWSDTRNRPTINVLASSIYGTVFLKSVDTNAEIKSGAYIFGVLKDVIHEVGPTNVVQVCMDSSTNCETAGRLIEETWPWIFYTRCTCHCLDLLFEDIGKCAWVDSALQSALKIITFITRKQYVLALFHKFSEKELLRPSTTRVAYGFIMLSNLLNDKVCGGLRKMVVSDEWCKWKGSKTEKAEEIVSIILDSSFWSDARMILNVCKPILKLLRLVDREGATMGLVYENTRLMMEKINNTTEIDPMKIDEIKRFCANRLTTLHSPLHATGYVLHPMWRGMDQESDHEVNMGWITTIMHYTNNDLSLQGVLLDELHMFRAQRIFGDPLSNDATRMKNAITWWEDFGTCTPNLRQLAIRVLSQGTCASPCERNWNTFSYIPTARRNQLVSTHVEKLLYLHTNLRLMRRIKERGFTFMEITLDTINNEEDEDRLLILQNQQKELQREEIESNSNDEVDEEVDGNN